MIVETIKDIAKSLRKARVPYMIIGAQAVNLYGKPRFTEDVDITVALTPKELDKLLKATARQFEPLPRDVQKFIQDTWVLPIKHRRSGVRVDVIFSITSFEREAIRKSRHVRVEGVSVRYIAPESLVVQKVIAGRPRDLEDARVVLEVQKKSFNLRAVEKIFRTFAEEEDGKAWLLRWLKLKKRTSLH